MDDIEDVLQLILLSATTKHTVKAVEDVLEAHRKLLELLSEVRQGGSGSTLEQRFIVAYNRFRSRRGGSE